MVVVVVVVGGLVDNGGSEGSIGSVGTSLVKGIVDVSGSVTGVLVVKGGLEG